MKRVMVFFVVLLSCHVIYGQMTDAVHEILIKAEQGDAEAQYNLGVSYYNGEGVAQDYAEAVKWWRKAAEQGYADAQYNLGLSYYTKFYQQDKALELFKAAARQGHKEAQKTLITLGEEW